MFALTSGAAIAVSLGGCNEYLDRRDSISPVNGDAVRQNMVTHMVDPWPRQAQDRHITLSGERAVINTVVTNEPPAKPRERSSTTVGGSGSGGR